MQLCLQFVFHQKHIPNKTYSNSVSPLGLMKFNIFINDLKGTESRLIKLTDTISWEGPKNVRGQG